MAKSGDSSQRGQRGKSKRSPLGFGTWQARGVGETAARSEFLWQLMRCPGVAPTVVRSLSDAGLAARARSGASVAEAIDTWARAHNLTHLGAVPHWIASQAAISVELWVLQPDLSRDLWPVGPCISAPIPDLLGQTFQVYVGPFTWTPWTEQRTEAERRILASISRGLKAQMNLIEKDCRSGGMEATLDYRHREHFEWAVRYQCGGPDGRGEETSRIAQSLDARSINSGVSRVLRLVGIDRRPAKCGRPKSRT
jgi:hypothetical protein